MAFEGKTLGRGNQFAARMRTFLGANAGVVAVIFALSLPMVMGAAGMAVDLAQAYNVKSRLGNALDKAALAGGGADTEANARALAESFFKANTAGENLGEFTTIEVDTSDWPATISVSATAHVPTTFMSALGEDSIEVSAHAKVAHELAGVEAVLVLDVTGSMDNSLNGTPKITALKKAVSGTSPYNANSFLNIIFDKIKDTQYIKIGVVPFAATVNVGSYGLGLDAGGAAYATAFVDRPAVDNSEGAGDAAYITPASNIQYAAPSAGATTNWWGCIRERASPHDTDDAATPNWGMYRYPKVCSAYNCLHTTCTRYNSRGNCTSSYCDTHGTTCTSWGNNDPNNGCTKSQILPMTNSKSVLQAAVDGLITGGNTYGNVGMAWGYHVISPTAPFMEGVSMNDKRWRKTVIFMSDGDNTTSNTYSAFGPNTSMSASDLDDKFLDVCANMKADGITIYTIAFGTTSTISTATRAKFKECASEPSDDHYFASSTGTDLSTAFEKIASQLAQLHIIE